MTYRRRAFLPAVIGPRASAAMLREFGVQMQTYADGLAASAHEVNRDLAGEVQRGLDSLAESARQWREREIGSAGGTAEPAEVVSVARSSSSGGLSMNVGQVAERVRVSRRYVRRLCEAGVLSASKPLGRDWEIDAASVTKYEAARRPVA